MYESILQFAIDLAMKICQRAENGEIRDLDVMAEAVLGDCREASIQVMGELIRNMNEGFREDKQTRKDLGLIIKEKDRSRSLLTALGQIDFPGTTSTIKGTADTPASWIRCLGSRSMSGSARRSVQHW